jgi:hypothetical protein
MTNHNLTAFFFIVISCASTSGCNKESSNCNPNNIEETIFEQVSKTDNFLGWLKPIVDKIKENNVDSNDEIKKLRKEIELRQSELKSLVNQCRNLFPGSHNGSTHTAMTLHFCFRELSFTYGGNPIEEAEAGPRWNFGTKIDFSRDDASPWIKDNMFPIINKIVELKKYEEKLTENSILDTEKKLTNTDIKTELSQIRVQDFNQNTKASVCKARIESKLKNVGVFYSEIEYKVEKTIDNKNYISLIDIN